MSRALLVLHPFAGSSNKVFDPSYTLSILPLRERLTGCFHFVSIQAEYTVEPEVVRSLYPPGVLEERFAYDAFSWSPPGQPFEYSNSAERIREAANREGPFYGAIGISQGAALLSRIEDELHLTFAVKIAPAQARVRTNVANYFLIGQRDPSLALVRSSMLEIDRIDVHSSGHSTIFAARHWDALAEWMRSKC
jgi:hypothetical protein